MISIYQIIIAVVVIGLISYTAWAIYFGWEKKHPLTLKEYLSKYLKAKTENGIACGICNSKSLKNLGALSAADTKRLVSCNSCSSPLYHAKQ